MNLILLARATKVIINHALIGKYRFRFFLRENFLYLYKVYFIETHRHILHKYKRFNKYWNLSRDIISYFIIFLELNSRTFSFIT